MRPQLFDPQFAASIFSAQRGKIHPNGEAIRNIAVNLRRDFSVPALRFDDAGQGNEIAGGFFRPCRGLLAIQFVFPRLAPWAAFFRRFAASSIIR